LNNNNKGFTLIEIMVAMAAGSIVMAAIVFSFWHLQLRSTSIKQRSELITNAQGLLFYISDNVKLVGFDPSNEIMINELVLKASPSELEFKRRNNADTAEVTVNISHDDAAKRINPINDDGSTRRRFLYSPNRNIENLRFAYAYDSDGDGEIELSANKNIIWAVDTDANGELDTILDTNDDGKIDTLDTAGGSKTLPSGIKISSIRLVKVWLLVGSQFEIKTGGSSQTFVVGDQRFTAPAGDNRGYLVFSTTIECKNMIN
jgi:prepilin-type N-terminal cleavage/methylation domain-containing protein